MSYMALYRKWRPASFADVRGQDVVVRTLKNQILSQRIGHAYLFCGTRGTGKTSVARILARAVNCEHPGQDGPCNQCESCRSILADASMNVVEIDAASNNRVDDIRELLENVRYVPAQGRYLVYIIDEVHMLTASAFNALLKTLEEPPPYAIFILATTEVHKLPLTILSRCQRYDFRRIGVGAIAGRLRELCQAEGIQAQEEALSYIASVSDGSLRDALSLLDQCVSFYYGETLTYDGTLCVLGRADSRSFSRIYGAVCAGKVREAVLVLEEAVAEGKELGQFVNELIWYMRNLLLVKSSPDPEGLVDASGEALIRLKEDAKKAEIPALMRYIRILSELSNQMRYSSQKRVLLEITLVRLACPQMQEDYSSILERLKVLEARLEGVGDVRAPLPAAPAAKEKELPVKTITLPPAEYEDLKRVSDGWEEILKGIGGNVRAFLKGTHIEPGGEGTLTVVFPDEMSYNKGGRRKVLEELEDFSAKAYGKKIAFKASTAQSSKAFQTVYVSREELEEKIKMPVTYEDEV